MVDGIFFALSIVPLIYELRRQLGQIAIDGLFVLNVSFSIVYGYTGLVLFESPTASHVSTQDGIDVIIAVTCLISYSAALLGYWIGTAIGARHRSSSLENCLDALVVYRAALVVFIVGVMSVFLYSSMYGGIANALKYAALIRAGYGDLALVGSGNLLFFKNLIPLLQFLPICLLGTFLNTRKLGAMFLFLGAFGIAVFGLFLMSGRGRVVLFVVLLAICGWSFVSRKRKISGASVVLAAIVMLVLDFFITYGKVFFRYFDSPDLDFLQIFQDRPYIPLEEFVNYYRHRVESIAYAINDTRFSPTFFYDSFAILSFVIPTRITGLVAPDSISYINTFLQTGLWDSMIPPGLVAYGYYSLGVAGVLLSSAVYGLVPGLIDRRNKVEGVVGNTRIYYRYPFLLIWLVYFLQGDPRVMIVNLASTLLFIVTIILLRLLVVKRM